MVGLAAPAQAATEGDIEEQVVLSGQAVIPSGQRAGEVVVFHGPIIVEGEAESVVAMDGAVTISGTVRRDVVAFNGLVTVTDGARIGGDLVTRRDPSVSPGATVEGSTKDLGAPPSFLWFRLMIWVAYGISMLVLGLLLLLVVPRAFEAATQAAHSRVGASIGWGLVLFFGLPVAAVLAMVTVVGIPLGLLLLFALFLVFSIGYVAAAWVLGRTLVKPPGRRFLAYLAGWVITWAATLIPFLGGFIWFAAVVFGLGALSIAMWRGGRPAPASAALSVD